MDPEPSTVTAYVRVRAATLCVPTLSVTVPVCGACVAGVVENEAPPATADALPNVSVGEESATAAPANETPVTETVTGVPSVAKVVRIR